jgi:hypothetical protein
VQPVSSAEVERLAAASGQVVQTVTVQHVGRLARLKQRRFTLGVLLGGLSVVGLLIRLTINFGGVTNESGQTHYSGLSPNTVAVITIVLASLSAIFWALGWAVRSRERYVQMQIERLAETLTDRATIADLFDEVGVDSLWTRNELREAIRTWTERSAPRSLHAPSRRKGLFHWLGFLAPDEHEEALSEVANKLGATDFTSLLVAKAIETQVVKEVAIVGPDGRRRHGYGFSV